MKNFKIIILLLAFVLSANLMSGQEKPAEAVKVAVPAAAADQVEQDKAAAKKEALSAFNKESEERLQFADKEQKGKYKEITKRYSEKGKALKELSLPKADYSKQKADLETQKDAEMKLVLNEVQYKTYIALKAEKKERMKKFQD